MSVTNLHPSYEEFSDQWQRIADCLKGRDAVIAGGERYLPKLNGHAEDHNEYMRYLTGGLWYGATSRTVGGLVGSVFRKEPQIKVPKRIEPRLENINARGDGFYTFAKKVVKEVVSMGRYGILVDRIESELPHLAGYSALAIRNWRYRFDGGMPKVDQVILYEESEQPSPDGFGSKRVPGYRVLELDQEGLYYVRFFVSNGEGEFVEMPPEFPMPDGGRIDYIPFVFMSALDLRAEIEKSPIIDMVDVNLSHWRSSCDLELGRTMLATPIPVTIGTTGGYTDDEASTTGQGANTYHMGGGRVWELPLGCDAKMLEFTGNGLRSLEVAMEQKEKYMAYLGSRMLEDTSRDAEAEQTVRIRKAGENSVLASVAKTVSDGLTSAMTMAAQWERLKGDVSVELNTDFMDTTISSDQLREMRETVQANLMPVDDFLWALKQGELLRPEITIEDARALLEQQEAWLIGRAMALDPAMAADPAPDEKPTGDSKKEQEGRELATEER